ncbi:glycoside hydrolase family 97 protein [Aporhodopirellula aestuarii]|uniref:Glycoside hydrolase family 97 protein n=1 Tax=Aporhodopirellula aestuarii TaxID=2950107 RepID=A0ABT0TYD5_9BACT|nr:glycoside hydrolase family 97 protein [Aporhodopirellula aestuarii]MCM2369614.1 glycoside hydrolase family 97 protein [Aporhodopirellula aestuarii]
MTKSIFASLLLNMFITAGLMAAPVAVQSPNGQVSASFDVQNGKLFYSVSKAGSPIVDASKVEIFPDAKMTLVDQSVRENDTSWSPVYGQFSTIRDHHRELTLSLTADGTPIQLLCRVFDTGVGFRFVLPKESAGKKMTYLSEYKLLGSAAHYAGQRGGEVKTLAKANRVAVPLVTERKDGLHIGFLESDLYSASGFEIMGIRFVAATGTLEASSSAVSIGDGQVTAWRVILIGETAGDLTLNTVALNLAAPCKLSDTSWIQPGKGLWDWRIHGYDNGEFVYDINTRSYLHLIDFCAEQGIEYFTVDDFWFTKAGNGKMTVSPDVDIAKVMSYAKEKGVKIMLYYDRKKGDFGDATLFRHYADLGATGMKYGFMGNRAEFTRAAIDAAAENKLLINFHDGPVPMAGVERTMPNLITREYCHGQQDSRSAFTPETFLKMAMVSSLTGPLDMSNGNFGINSINAGERQKGPRKMNSYISTVVSEVARNLVIYTGLVTLPDAPEEYLKKADLFEYLKQMPATWDDSRVLHSKIGKYITVARRSGDAWFVGSVSDQTAQTLNISLGFLDPDKTYEATIYQDAPDSHGSKNPEAYQITTALVKHSDMIPAEMAVGGGHAMILRPTK